jgi:hypothetical protein
MRKYNDIKKAVEKKGYKFFTNDNFDVNLIFERTSNKFTDKFDDILYICYVEKGLGKVEKFNCTTKPGYKKSADTPQVHEGIKGIAVITPNQYRSVWQYTEGGVEGRQYPFNVTHLRQIKGMNYWRDANGDTIIDEEQLQINKIFGTHFHVMSYEGRETGVVSNWSKGCMGCMWTDYWKIMNILKQATVFWGNRFTLTLLESKDF